MVATMVSEYKDEFSPSLGEEMTKAPAALQPRVINMDNSIEVSFLLIRTMDLYCYACPYEDRHYVPKHDHSIKS